jgi:hypothetical protein
LKHHLLTTLKLSNNTNIKSSTYRNRSEVEPP